MHVHHKRNESVYAKGELEHVMRHHSHYLEVNFVNEWASIGGRSEQADDRDLLADIWSLFLRESNEGLCSALGMSNERQLAESRLSENARDECWEIEDAHLPDVPVPHSWI